MAYKSEGFVKLKMSGKSERFKKVWENWEDS